MTIILDYGLAILDRREEQQELTAKNAENAENINAEVFLFVFFAFFVVIRLGLDFLRFLNERSDQFRPKNRLRNPLMVNGVKPVSNRVRPLYVGSQGNG